MGTNEARPVRHMRCVYTSCIATRFEWDDEKNRINKRKHGSLEFESKRTANPIPVGQAA